MSRGASKSSKASGDSNESLIQGGNSGIYQIKERSFEEEPAPEFFAHEPPLESPEEILCLPDPLGGEYQIILTAAPLPQVSVFASSKPSRSFWSRLFPFRRLWQKELKTTSNIERIANPSSGLPVTRDAVSERHILTISRLQSIDGSFSLPSLIELPILGISEPQLRASIPPSLAAANSKITEVIWATAIAVAFLDARFHSQMELWRVMKDKAVQFGISACGDNGLVFKEIVQQAQNLFLVP